VSPPSHSTLGCGIFIQQEKFAVISSHKITLRSPPPSPSLFHPPWPPLIALPSDFAPLMNCRVEEYADWIKKKPHSLAVCHLLLKSTNQRFLLVSHPTLPHPVHSDRALSLHCSPLQGNARLCSNESDPDVRAIQTQSIINSLTTLLKQEVISVSSLSLSPFLRKLPLISLPLSLLVFRWWTQRISFPQLRPQLRSSSAEILDRHQCSKVTRRSSTRACSPDSSTTL
jgi:hypothetical protein